MFAISALKWAVLATCLAAAVISDVRSRRIPNPLCAVALILGVSLQVVISGVDGAWNGLWGTLVGALILAPFYLSGGMGAGDVKLMAAVGAFLGPWGALLAALLTIVIGGVMGGGVALWRQICLWAAANDVAGFRNVASFSAWKIEFPYAAAIAIGAVAGPLIESLRPFIQ